MMFLFYFLFYFQTYKMTKYDFHNSNTYDDKCSGYDERFSINGNATNACCEEIIKIRILYNKKKLLDKLKDNNTSIYEKLQLIEDNSIKPSNINACNLTNRFFANNMM